MEKLKKCSVCNETKNHDCFHKDNRKKDGLSIRCKVCQAKKAKKYNDSNKERLSKHKRDWYHKNKETILISRRFQRRSNPEFQMLALAKYRAKKNGLPFNLELSDIHIPEFCPVLNIKLNVAVKNVEDYSPSIDKIIPQLGYIKGNVQVISKLANTMKNSASLEQLVLFSEWINKHVKPLIESNK